MTKHYIITTTNKNELYFTFLPTVYKMWKIYIPNCIFVLGYIGNDNEDDIFIKHLKKFCDKLHIFKNIPNMDSGCQAKTTRMFLASTYLNDICTVVDIDYYLLNLEWFNKKIKPAFTDNKFVSIGHNHYFGTPHIGKFPMCLTTAPSNVWKKIININNLDYNNWFNYISNLPDPIDYKENPQNIFNKFSDESLLRYFLNKHHEQDYIKNIWIKQEREDSKCMKCSKRIDRSYWNEFQLELLNQNYYIDSNPLRPFNKYFNYIVPILKKINIKLSDELMI